MGPGPLGRAGLYVAKFGGLLRMSYGAEAVIAAYYVVLVGGDGNEQRCETPMHAIST